VGDDDCGVRSKRFDGALIDPMPGHHIISDAV
jgi:hypothetical protein